MLCICRDAIASKNYIILTVKYFIWKTKFLNISLELEEYKHYLKNKLRFLQTASPLVANVDKVKGTTRDKFGLNSTIDVPITEHKQMRALITN